MTKTMLRVAAATAVAAGAFIPTALSAQASSTSVRLQVGQEACLSQFAQNPTQVFGFANPYAVRYTVRVNGATVYQATSQQFSGTYGPGFIELCGKNKLGNPGPTDVYLQIS
ncbi:MAG: hypothetical protein V9G08_11095 [Dermatophilaceae bacterium]